MKLSSTVALALLACALPAHAQTEAPSIEGLPAGAYTLDPSHASLSFKVNHLGFSNYTARFTTFDAQLQLDPANPEAATLTASVDPASLALPSPPEGFLDMLLGPDWFDAAQFPAIAFASTRIELTGANTALIHGDLTLHGVTAPVTLDATYNGGWAGIPQDPHARVGFSAHGELSRTAFGMGFGVPEPGSTMGVGDAVSFAIETEFSGPEWKGAESGSAAGGPLQPKTSACYAVEGDP